VNVYGINSSTHFVIRLRDGKRREWFVHVNDGIRSSFGATWSGSRIEIATWVLAMGNETIQTATGMYRGEKKGLARNWKGKICGKVEGSVGNNICYSYPSL
jgi:hypothetical protein